MTASTSAGISSQVPSSARSAWRSGTAVITQLSVRPSPVSTAIRTV